MSANSQTAAFKLLYNGKNITEDISRFILSVEYNDKTDGFADEIQLEVDNTGGMWNETWYPGFGDKLSLSIGYFGEALLPAGDFEIDELEIAGQPDVMKIRAMGAGIKKGLRTKRSHAHESTTLRKVAQTIAAKAGLTLQGDIQNIQLNRASQYRETDLSFLQRVASEYGYAFNVRGNKLVFTNMLTLETGKAVKTIDRADCLRYTIKDKSSGTYKKATVSYHDPKQKLVVTHTTSLADEILGYDAPIINTVDVFESRTRTETRGQAEVKSKALLYKKNSKKHESNIEVPGDPYLVAGNNIKLTGFGVMSGTYHITESRHHLDRTQGYRTEVQIKRVRTATKKEQKRKPLVKQRAVGIPVNTTLFVPFTDSVPGAPKSFIPNAQ